MLDLLSLSVLALVTWYFSSVLNSMSCSFVPSLNNLLSLLFFMLFLQILSLACPSSFLVFLVLACLVLMGSRCIFLAKVALQMISGFFLDFLCLPVSGCSPKPHKIVQEYWGSKVSININQYIILNNGILKLNYSILNQGVYFTVHSLWSIRTNCQWD